MRSPRVKYLKVKDGRRLGITGYPSFHKSGSIAGMRKKYYGKNARLVRCGSYIYNVSEDQHGHRIYEEAH